jgi:hypothetical protein
MQAPRAAVEQANAQTRFKRLNVIASHLGRDPKVTCGSREASCLNGLLKHRHTEEPVHGVIPNYRFGNILT